MINNTINPLKGRCVNWHSGTSALSPERQSARVSEIKNAG